MKQFRDEYILLKEIKMGLLIMERNYNSEPGYLTVNQSVDRIIEVLKEDDNQQIRGKYYRDIIKLAKKDVLKNKKSGRNYWIDENEVDKYIEKKLSISKKYMKYNDGKSKKNEISTSDIKDIINLLEKAEVPSEKILKLVKEKLNMNNINLNMEENNE